MNRRKVTEVPRTWIAPTLHPEAITADLCPVSVPDDAALDECERSELVTYIKRLEQALCSVKAALVATLPRAEFERLRKVKIAITNERLRVQVALSKEKDERTQERSEVELARERAFIIAARKLLPLETYKDLWAEVDRMQETP
jgi:hypothetical protein